MKNKKEVQHEDALTAYLVSSKGYKSPLPVSHAEAIRVPNAVSNIKSAISEVYTFNKLDYETPTQQKIKDILSGMTDLLLYKNKKYGDSAISPKKIFYKGDSTNSILIRLDDKIGRVMSNTEEKPRVNDVCDIIGYCTLLLISMGVTAEDIEKFKD